MQQDCIEEISGIYCNLFRREVTANDPIHSLLWAAPLTQDRQPITNPNYPPEKNLPTTWGGRGRTTGFAKFYCNERKLLKNAIIFNVNYYFMHNNISKLCEYCKFIIYSRFRSCKDQKQILQSILTGKTQVDSFRQEEGTCGNPAPDFYFPDPPGERSNYGQ